MAHLDAASGASEQLAALEIQHRRLQVLLGELLQANQELRFKVEELKQRAERAERGLAQSRNAAGVQVP